METQDGSWLMELLETVLENVAQSYKIDDSVDIRYQFCWLGYRSNFPHETIKYGSMKKYVLVDC